MGDSEANPVQVSKYKSLSWIFKCTSWQYDRLLERCQLTGSWDDTGVCNASYPTILPPDVIIIQFRYQDRGCHVLPVNFWVRKDVFLSSQVNNHKTINLTLSRVIEKLNPECTHLKSDLIREVIDVARTLASMPRNVGREGLGFVYQVSAMPSSLKVEIDSLARFKFVEDVANSETQVCAVCMDDISKGDDVIFMPCSHIYHGECILGWLEKKPKCPTCLMALPMDNC